MNRIINGLVPSYLPLEWAVTVGQRPTMSFLSPTGDTDVLTA